MSYRTRADYAEWIQIERRQLAELDETINPPGEDDQVGDLPVSVLEARRAATLRIQAATLALARAEIQLGRLTWTDIRAYNRWDDATDPTPAADRVIGMVSALLSATQTRTNLAAELAELAPPGFRDEQAIQARSTLWGAISAHLTDILSRRAS